MSGRQHDGVDSEDDTSANELEARIQRRGVLKGILGTSALAVGSPLLSEPVAAEPTPLASYDFEGSGSTVIDGSGNEHSGTLVRASRISGRDGTVLQFEKTNDEYAELGTADSLDPGSGSYTVSLWFKSSSTTNKHEVLFAKRGNNNERFRITTRDQGQINFGLKDDPGAGATRIVTSETYTDATWHHVVAVRDTDQDNLELYVDDELVGSVTDAEDDVDPTGPAFLGGQPEYPNPRYYTGQIDDVKIYEAALTPKEIPSETEPKIKISDLKLIQRVDTTRLEGIEHPGEDVPIEDPPIFKELNMGVLAELQVEDPERLPQGETIITVSYGGLNKEDDVTRVSTSQIKSRLDDGKLQFDEFDTVLDIGNGSDPVFNPSDSLSDVTVSFEHDSSDYQKAERSISFPPEDQSVSKLEKSNLKVGFVGIKNISIYGSPDLNLVAEHMKRMEQLFPVEKVSGYVHDKKIVGSDLPNDFGLIDIGIDQYQARNTLDGVLENRTVEPSFTINGGERVKSEQDISEFDVTVGLVPAAYFDYHLKDVNGLHPVYSASEDEDPSVQPPASVLVRESKYSTTAHEATHHLIGEPYDGDYSAEDSDDSHAADGLKSNYYDLSEGSMRAVFDISSFMTQSGGGGIDAIAYNTLIKNQLDPVPDEGTRTEDKIARLLAEFENGDLIIRNMTTSSGGIAIDRPVGQTSVLISALDNGGNVLGSVNIPSQLGQVFETGAESTVDAILGHVPFPEETYKISIETGSITTEFNPFKQILRTEITRIPDSGFITQPDERRNALLNKLEPIDKQIDEKAFRGAKQKMEKDLRDKINKWLKDDYEAAANQPTKQEMLELVDDMIARLETLIQNSSNGNSDRGNSKGKGR